MYPRKKLKGDNWKWLEFQNHMTQANSRSAINFFIHFPFPKMTPTLKKDFELWADCWDEADSSLWITLGIPRSAWTSETIFKFYRCLTTGHKPTLFLNTFQRLSWLFILYHFGYIQGCLTIPNWNDWVSLFLRMFNNIKKFNFIPRFIHEIFQFKESCIVYSRGFLVITWKWNFS